MINLTSYVSNRGTNINTSKCMYIHGLWTVISVSQMIINEQVWNEGTLIVFLTCLQTDRETDTCVAEHVYIMCQQDSCLLSGIKYKE